MKVSSEVFGDPTFKVTMELDKAEAISFMQGIKMVADMLPSNVSYIYLLERLSNDLGRLTSSVPGTRTHHDNEDLFE